MALLDATALYTIVRGRVVYGVEPWPPIKCGFLVHVKIIENMSIIFFL
ncbi:MAG: hypothetical protein BMS9Abin05_1497 [Rhodothermia bacterium]|nr:MAG: hypothetical protein BMS9Abin05_1497 [Rhodothermia bacterium]